MGRDSPAGIASGNCCRRRLMPSSPLPWLRSRQSPEFKLRHIKVRSIYWQKRLTQARISSADLHEVSQEEIEGRIVLIGTTAAGLSDMRATPVEPSVPGVEIHAPDDRGLLQQCHPRAPGLGPAAEVMVGLIASLLIVLLLPMLPPLASLALLTTAVLLFGAGSFVSFERARLLFDATFPSTCSRKRLFRGNSGVVACRPPSRGSELGLLSANSWRRLWSIGWPPIRADWCSVGRPAD